MPNQYFAANSLAAFSRTTAGVVEITTAGWFNSAFVPHGIFLPGSGLGVAESPSFGPATGVAWTRFDLYIRTALNDSSTLFELRNGGAALFRLQGTTGQSHLTPQYWNGSAWVSGSTFLPGLNVLMTLTVRVTFGVSWEVFQGGVSVSSGTMAGSPPTQATSVYFRSVGSIGAIISQVMVADYDIRDSKYMPATLNALSGVNTDGTGPVTNINETVLSDAESISLTTSGHKRGFTNAGITVPTGYRIAAMSVSARGRASGAITDGKLGIRSAGTNYSGPNAGYNAGYAPKQRILPNDPATATEFTQSGFNAAEIFLEAA
jgi:hypothetical protein